MIQILWLSLLLLLAWVRGSSSVDTVPPDTYLDTVIGFPNHRTSITYIPPDLDMYRVLMTLKFEKNFTADIENEDPDGKSLYKTKVTTIFRDRFKFECNIRYHSSAPYTQYCIRKFDITTYIQPNEPFKIKFVSSTIVESKSVFRPLFAVHASFRLSANTQPTTRPMNVSMEKYNSMMEAFRNQGPATAGASYSSQLSESGTDTDTLTVRNSGLSDYISRKTWKSPTDSKIRFTFQVLRIEKQQYFLSSKIHFALKSDHKKSEPSVNTKPVAFVVSINDDAPISDHYISDLDKEQNKCSIVLTGNVVYRSCLEFYEFSPVSVNSQEQAKSNVSVAVSLHYLGQSEDLIPWNIVVSTTLHVLPNAFQSWREVGVSNEMISCFLADANIQSISKTKDIGVLHISNNGNNIAMLSGYKSSLFEGRLATNSLPFRLRAMQLGVKKAVQLAKTELKVNPFPDLHALFWPSDDSHLNRNTYINCTLPFPPLFAQNRDYEAGNMLVLAPDFSFFSDFWGGFDHGSSEDIWFDVVESERQADLARANNEGTNTNGVGQSRKSSKYNAREFEEKNPTAIFRGKTAQRKFAYLRSTVTDSAHCGVGGLVNATSAQYVSKQDMCRDHQAVITIPGNGVWSWATKFNLVSIPI
jgi:hypothetical protein